MNRAIRLMAMALIASTPACSPRAKQSAKDKPEVVRSEAGSWHRVRKLIQGQSDRHEIAGAVVLVQHRGKPVVYEAFGLADMETKAPMTRDTIFRLASLTKPITNVAVMMLVEEGKLRIDDPLSKHLSDFADMTVLVPIRGSSGGDKGYRIVKAERPITIHHLLTHTSGIIYRFSGRRYLAKMYADAGVSDGLAETDGTLGENVKRIGRLPLYFQPGTAWEYGLNTDVLGRIVEVLSGKPLDEFLRERIWEPLQMSDTAFIVPKEKRSRLAALHTQADKKTLRRVANGPIRSGWFIYSATSAIADDNRYLSAGGGLTSTARDYARFLQMLLNRGELDGKRLLKPETVDLMAQNHIGDLSIPFGVHGDGFGYGFGVVTGREVPSLPASVGSYSWGGMFNTFFWVDPRRELFAILLTQLYPFTELTPWRDFQAKVYADLGAERP